MIVFSTLPMRVLDFTQKAEVIQAAIAAGNIGRGLSETDIGQALLQALSFFDDRAYTGSRLILLVSDGGDRIDPDTRERIAHLTRKQRVAVYWIYIRTNTSPGLMLGADEPPSNADTVPEYFLHRFFQSMGTPYRAYEAENPQSLQKAIDEVNRLENLPINYLDTVPRRELAPACWGLALLCVLLLLGANRLEIKAWA
jgi:mxaC protein